MDDILYEARLLADSGVKELLVVAQDTSRYGTDFPGGKRLLPELLRRLCTVDGLEWIRIHYLYPDEIDDELIDVIASEPKIVKYLDIPIQHCNDKILKLMNRRGNGGYLRELFTKLRNRIPGLILRTSVITGLPGEDEDAFEELCEFLKEMRLERVGAFAFSPEEGTPAFDMEHPDSQTAQERAQIVELIQSRIMDEFNNGLLGKCLSVLVDGYDEEYGQYFGRTYADSPEIDGKVWISADEPVTEGSFVKVCVDGFVDGDLSGYLMEENEQ
jgi:ribosomal protein S12 methylthiotransferase